MHTILSSAFLLAAAAQAQDVIRNPHATPADVAAGAKTFRSFCSPCHGFSGEGGRGPNLAAGVFFRGSSDSELFANIKGGIPGTEMPGIYYEEDKVWQIVAYVRSLHADPEKATGNAATGAALYAAKGCVGCHRIGGQGGWMGPDLSRIGSARALAHLRQSLVDPEADMPNRYWRVSFKDSTGASMQGFVLSEDTYELRILDMKRQLKTFTKASITGLNIDKRSPMPSYRDKLSDTELNDLVTYLSALRAE